MASVTRSFAIFALATGMAVLSASGCSQQGEGERCDKVKAGDSDCDSGLVCVPRMSLVDKTADRCCPADNRDSDERCTRSTGSSPGGSGSGGSGGGSGEGGAVEGGSAGAVGGEPNPSAGAGAGGTAGEGAGGAPVVSEGGVPGAGAPSAGAPSAGGQGGSD